MNAKRREFLEKSLVATGVGAVGFLTSQVMSRLTKSDDKPDKPSGPRTPLLTPEGELVHVEEGKTVPADHHHAAPTDSAVRRGVPGRKWVMVIDLAKCDGCKACTVECCRMHHTPPDREWIKVFKMQSAHQMAPYWFPKPCFHCDNPPCTKVCPVGATFKRQDGVVLIDNIRCIGCRFCMAACPYSTRFFNWGRPEASAAQSAYSPETGVPRRIGTVEKCDFCPDMAKEGILPGCVSSCTMGALYFGDQNEDAVTNAYGESFQLSKLLENQAGYRYLEELGTEPSVYYLPPKYREYAPPQIHRKEESEPAEPHHHHHPSTPA